MFADEYRNINLAQFAFPVHVCLEALITQGILSSYVPIIQLII